MLYNFHKPFYGTYLELTALFINHHQIVYAVSLLLHKMIAI